MRRGAAILLGLVFSFSLIAPALPALDANQDVHACCRRDGKHHCMAPASGPSFQAARCGLFSPNTMAPAGRMVSLPGMRPAAMATLTSQAAVASHTISLSRSSYSRAGEKRGPPLASS